MLFFEIAILEFIASDSFCILQISNYWCLLKKYIHHWSIYKTFLIVKKYYLTTKRELKNNYFYCPKQVNLVDHLKIKYKNANRQ